ncbi:hypothetical protein A1QO_02610 [Vibrio genomosp. F10 str. ZF-129]|uniref:Restriction endonuclease n=1 Tax=Vibrio genomosp. F10 str. ZF-129 TaxID=1187848 RepID=A0A1E5BK91_9VIBR|nr:hypothetical protein [Vibrio genomosp. F10]OEE38289.1 hypothetical protein A1QO_02610 [Vibrio genomosp. F10 str. ZF-129]
MKDIPIKNEAEIADVAKVFLELNGWYLYPEVVIDLFNGRPDYIGVKNSLCQTVECKKSLTYPLIEQLARWQIDADKRKEWQEKSSIQREIAIPHLLVAFVSFSSARVSDLKKLLLKQYRIGVYSISKRMNLRTLNRVETPYICSADCHFWTLVWGDYEYTIRLEVPPKIQHGSNATAHRIINSLNEDMRGAQSGVRSCDTNYMTPFKRTMNRVRKVLSDGKERHIQTIINDIRPLGGHHYCSDQVASNSITKFIDKFDIAIRTKDHGAWFQIADDEEVKKK